MIGRSSNEFYQTLKDNNLPAIGLFCSQASISFDFSIGIQGGWKFESGPFKGLSLMVNLVSADLFSIDIPLDFLNLDILFDKETNLNYIEKNGLKKISQELSLGCVVGIGLGQEFTTKVYGYNSQNSWYNCLFSIKQDGIKKTWTGSLDINYTVALLLGGSVTASIPLTYKR